MFTDLRHIFIKIKKALCLSSRNKGSLLWFKQGLNWSYSEWSLLLTMLVLKSHNVNNDLLTNHLVNFIIIYYHLYLCIIFNGNTCTLNIIRWEKYRSQYVYNCDIHVVTVYYVSLFTCNHGNNWITTWCTYYFLKCTY